MNVEEAVLEHLSADAGVTALVGSRIYQLKLPQQPTLPAVRVQLVSERDRYHLRGGDAMRPALVQIDAFAAEASGSDPYASATAIGDAIHTALSGEKFFAGSPVAFEVVGAFRADRRIGYEADELRLVRESQDYMVWGKAVS